MKEIKRWGRGREDVREMVERSRYRDQRGVMKLWVVWRSGVWRSHPEFAYGTIKPQLL